MSETNQPVQESGTKPAGDGKNHGEHHGFSHVASVKVLVGTFSALIALTVITVLATKIDLGPQNNLIIAMVIATIKAGLVCAFFMHLIYDKLLHSIAFLGALLFALLFVGITLMDSNQYQDDIVWEDPATEVTTS